LLKGLTYFLEFSKTLRLMALEPAISRGTFPRPALSGPKKPDRTSSSR